MKLKTKKQNQRGFTLIELLIVVSIIGLLSSIMIVTFKAARSKARDANRIQQSRSILNALALEYNSKGKFPCHHAFDNSDSSHYMNFLVTDKFLVENPEDPINSGNYIYSYMTFKSVAGGTCGQISYIDYTTENPIQSCIGNGILFNNNHCHIFFPAAPNCPNWTDANLTSCSLKDTADDY